MDTEVSVVGRAIKTEIDTERDGRPGGIFRATIKAYLRGQFLRKWSVSQGLSAYFIRGLGLQFLEDLLGLRLGGTHGECNVGYSTESSL